MSDEDDGTRMSRSGRTVPGGKLTERLDIPVSEELSDAIVALAVVAGMSRAEYARALLERAVWGEMSMLRRLARAPAPGRWDEPPSNDRGQGG